MRRQAEPIRDVALELRHKCLLLARFSAAFVPLDGLEYVKHATRGRCTSIPVFRIEWYRVVLGRFQRLSKLPLQLCLDHQGKEVREQQRLDSRRFFAIHWPYFKV